MRVYKFLFNNNLYGIMSGSGLYTASHEKILIATAICSGVIGSLTAFFGLYKLDLPHDALWQATLGSVVFFIVAFIISIVLLSIDHPKDALWAFAILLIPFVYVGVKLFEATSSTQRKRIVLGPENK